MDILRGEQAVEVEGMKMWFTIKLPRDQSLPLNRSTTAVWMATAKARGLTEAQIISILEFCLASQLDGVVGVRLKTVQMEAGKPPHLFWNWWSSSTEIQILFDSNASMQRALVAIASGEIELYLYDGATLERSALAVRAWAVQLRGVQLDAPDEEVMYAGVHAQTRARHFFHLHATGHNAHTFTAVKETYGHACTTDPVLLEKKLLERLREVAPELPIEGVELIRRDTAQEEATAKAGKPTRIEGRSLGGNGPRAWFWIA